MSVIRWAAVNWLRTRTVDDLYELDPLQARSEEDASVSEAFNVLNLTWDPLTDDEGNLIRLDSLIFLGGTTSHREEVVHTDHVTEGLERGFFEENLAQLYGKPVPRPLGPQQLRDLNTGEYGNGLIVSPSSSGILALSNRRYCISVEDRWRAVQSVLGVSGWRKLFPEDCQNEFVLGMYPLAFVYFVADQIGAEFYGADTISTKCDFDRRVKSMPPGSMMCFRPHKSQSNLICLPRWLVGGVREAIDHPSVTLWVI
ncbi:hypothetical protein MBLNU13_g10980t1 [Cladosporium sp. NU13]